MNPFYKILQGGDLRSIGQSNAVVSLVNDQASFDALFELLHYTDRKLVMRSADAIEKISLQHPGYLKKHKQALLQLAAADGNIELKWHLSLLLPRLPLTKKELHTVWELLTCWALNKKESKIVRVNALQALFDLSRQQKDLEKAFRQTVALVSKENIASINARIKKLH